MGTSNKLSVALIYALFASGSLVFLTFLIYLGGVPVFLGWIANLKYPIMILVAILACLTEKKRNGGYLEFRAALKTCFTIFVLALAIQTFFIWLLMNVFDPAFRERVLAAVPARITAAYQWFGATQEQIDRAIAEEKGVNTFSLGRMFQGLGFTYILQFLIALLIAAIVRRKA